MPSTEEMSLLAHCSVFQGGFTEEAALAVTNTTSDALARRRFLLGVPAHREWVGVVGFDAKDL